MIVLDCNGCIAVWCDKNVKIWLQYSSSVIVMYVAMSAFKHPVFEARVSLTLPRKRVIPRCDNNHLMNNGITEVGSIRD